MDQKFLINGGKKLKGEINISGAKNAVLKLMAAALLLDDTCEIHNVPELADVQIMVEVLKSLGAKVNYDIVEKKISIDASEITSVEACYELVSKMRASFTVLGALLGRCKEAKVALPGGCSIGERRIDFHIKGLEALGAQIKIEGGYVIAKAKKLVGSTIYLDRPSVGATENVMIAAVLAEGSTIISNAAQEPEIADLANFLNALGADISGAGTSEIVINGVKQKDLHPACYTTIPDRIEAGTYIAAVVATRGKAVIRNIFPSHLSAVISKLTDMGAVINILDPFSLEVSCGRNISAVNIVTQPHPGFPTDLQSPFMSVLSVADGISIITESIYENRFRQIGELIRMGANVQQEGNRAIIKGVRSLTGAQVKASDLRAGASLLVAALCAEGTTTITDLHHIDRGYEKVLEKLSAVGADIQRLNITDNDLNVNNINDKIIVKDIH